MKTITVDVKHDTYDIILERGCINQLSKYFDVTRKIFILTDQNVPDKWVSTVNKQCLNSIVYKVKGGEESKSIQTYEEVLKALLDYHMTRSDLIIALGGGVIGDLCGFVASSYMRGIDFISIPTTTLSQIDSSIGGKTAINLGEVKNIVGAFYHPKKVLIDFETLSTLPQRQITNGLIEAIKAGLIQDESLFNLFESKNYMDHLEEIIYKSLMMKKRVVEADEKEHGIRKILNFGHTLGHGIEAYYHLDKYLHGECVAMGMLYFIDNKEIKDRVLNIYKNMNIKVNDTYDPHTVYELCTMDKKTHGNKVSIIKVKKIGEAIVQDIEIQELQKILERGNI